MRITFSHALVLLAWGAAGLWLVDDAAAELVAYAAPHMGIEVRDTAAKDLPAGPANLVVTENDLTWNIWFQDTINGSSIGFDGPMGNAAEADVEGVVRYISQVLNQPGTLDVQFVPSETDGSGFLAAAGTFYPVGAPGYYVGSSHFRLENGVKQFSNAVEIEVTVDFGHNFHFGEGTPGATESDFRSVLLHEFTHGLGYATLLENNGSGSSSITDTTTVFQSLIQRSSDNMLLWSGNPPTFQGIPADLTSNALSFTGSQAAALYDQGVQPGIYAPPTYQAGSSIVHWDAGNIAGGAVMEPAMLVGTSRRTYAPVDIGALIDLGYTNAAAVAAEGEGEEDCTLDGPCPNLNQEGITIYNTLALNWDMADADFGGIIDSWEVALFGAVLCDRSGPLHDEALCTFVQNRATLRTEPDYAGALEAQEGVIAALLSISTELQTTTVATLALENTYAVAQSPAKQPGEPFAPQGNPDGDAFSNLEEFQNAQSNGLQKSDYVEAALNPALDGTTGPSALPLTTPLGILILLLALAVAVVLLAWRRCSTAA
ncbi:MAG: hypothetical protein ACLFTT_01450 [Candidatus Hydrogenedentota bacterium]